MSNIQYGYIKPLPSTTTQVRWPDAPTYVRDGINTERKTMSKPHTEQFADALMAKMGAAGESDEIYGSFLDLIMELIMSLFSDCPASRLKRAASGKWVRGYFAGLFALRDKLSENLSDGAFGGRFDSSVVEGQLKEVARELPLDVLEGMLAEAKEK